MPQAVRKTSIIGDWKQYIFTFVLGVSNQFNSVVV